MSKNDPKKKPKRERDDKEPRRDPKTAEQEEAIAEASDEEEGEPPLARDRQPKPEDADRAKESGGSKTR